MKYVYPCILIPEEIGGYSVTFPDIAGATQGDTLLEALEMAQDLASAEVSAVLEDGEEIPIPTPPEKIEVPAGAFMTLITVDTSADCQELKAS